MSHPVAWYMLVSLLSAQTQSWLTTTAVEVVDRQLTAGKMWSITGHSWGHDCYCSTHLVGTSWMLTRLAVGPLDSWYTISTSMKIWTCHNPFFMIHVVFAPSVRQLSGGPFIIQNEKVFFRSIFFNKTEKDNWFLNY